MSKPYFWQSRIINGCLIAVVLLAVAPQYWPGMATLSGIAAIACGIVAAAVYFIRPSAEFHENDVEADARESSAHVKVDVVLEGVSELADAKAALKPRLQEGSYNLYGDLLIGDYEKAVIRWLALDRHDEQQFEEMRRTWARKLATVEGVRRGSVGQSVYIVPVDKIRRKVPRSQSGAMEPAISPFRSRAIH